MTKLEKKLLYILIWIMIILAFLFSRSFLVEKQNDLEEKLTLKTLQIQRLHSSTEQKSELLSEIDDLELLIVKHQSEYYDPANMDSYSFGIYIRNLLQSYNLDISRYSREEGAFLEFHIRGNALYFFQFLKEYSLTAGMHEIPSLSIRKEEDGILSIVMRCRYAGMVE